MALLLHLEKLPVFSKLRSRPTFSKKVLFFFFFYRQWLLLSENSQLCFSATIYYFPEYILALGILLLYFLYFIFYFIFYTAYIFKSFILLMKFYLCVFRLWALSVRLWFFFVGPTQRSACPVKLFHPAFKTSDTNVQPYLSLMTLAEFREKNASSVN